MEKLRHDIKTVFNRQQSGLGYTAGVSDRLLRQALAPTPARPRFAPQLAAAIATLLLGAALAYVVVVTHGHLKSQNPVTHVTPTPRPTVSVTPSPLATALAQPLAVPDSTPVILYHDGVNLDQVDGGTWDGLQKGRVGTTGGPGLGILPNPAGTLYFTFRDIRDRSGRILATRNAKGFGTWADGGKHYCRLASASAVPPASGEPATLQLVTAAGAATNIARVGFMYEQAGADVAACSTDRDRAVVSQLTSVGAGTQVWVVQLSTGRILWTRSGNFIASRDGQYLAEAQPNGGPWTIYNAAGAVAGHVAGQVQSFSWDGSLVTVGQYGSRPSVIDWRSGKVIWTAPAGTTYTGSLPEPGGARIAIELQTPGHPQTGGYPTVDVYAIGPDGSAVQILSNVSL